MGMWLSSLMGDRYFTEAQCWHREQSGKVHVLSGSQLPSMHHVRGSRNGPLVTGKRMLCSCRPSKTWQSLMWSRTLLPTSVRSAHPAWNSAGYEECGQACKSVTGSVSV